MYLVDTNVISEMRKIRHRKADPNVTAWVNSVNPNLFYTSIVVMMELQRGVMGKHRTDPEQGKRLQQWFDISVKGIFDKRVLYINDHIADVCAGLHVPNPKPENDAWIAATAIAHGLTLVTRNVSDFDGIAVDIINPFTYQPSTS
ncbi:type II toxin-antitoxin system VapC family toxin [Moraxella sp. PS-22]|uniref:Ribonuclease VapC n=1 Tax=Moraxella tetraodonis TaxID=2767221 RepID=A0A9X2A5A8_9GAMM|nr:type II toxin-antitoxin system VapC family toxin [Moraxella tetraodonis]MCG8148787.1 type II toxin-antitoxin system VapC family toxin [Moraxella tetraodonis]